MHSMQPINTLSFLEENTVNRLFTLLLEAAKEMPELRDKLPPDISFVFDFETVLKRKNSAKTQEANREELNNANLLTKALRLRTLDVVNNLVCSLIKNPERQIPEDYNILFAACFNPSHWVATVAELKNVDKAAIQALAAEVKKEYLETQAREDFQQFSEEHKTRILKLTVENFIIQKFQLKQKPDQLAALFQSIEMKFYDSRDLTESPDPNFYYDSARLQLEKHFHLQNMPCGGQKGNTCGDHSVFNLFYKKLLNQDMVINEPGAVSSQDLRAFSQRIDALAKNELSLSHPLMMIEGLLYEEMSEENVNALEQARQMIQMILGLPAHDTPLIFGKISEKEYKDIILIEKQLIDTEITKIRKEIQAVKEPLKKFMKRIYQHNAAHSLGAQGAVIREDKPEEKEDSIALTQEKTSLMEALFFNNLDQEIILPDLLYVLEEAFTYPKKYDADILSAFFERPWDTIHSPEDALVALEEKRQRLKKAPAAAHDAISSEYQKNVATNSAALRLQISTLKNFMDEKKQQILLQLIASEIDSWKEGEKEVLSMNEIYALLDISIEKEREIVAVTVQKMLDIMYEAAFSVEKNHYENSQGNQEKSSFILSGLQQALDVEIATIQRIGEINYLLKKMDMASADFDFEALFIEINKIVEEINEDFTREKPSYNMAIVLEYFNLDALENRTSLIACAILERKMESLARTESAEIIANMAFLMEEKINVIKKFIRDPLKQKEILAIMVENLDQLIENKASLVSEEAIKKLIQSSLSEEAQAFVIQAAQEITQLSSIAAFTQTDQNSWVNVKKAAVVLNQLKKSLHEQILPRQKHSHFSLFLNWILKKKPLAEKKESQQLGAERKLSH